MPNVTLVKHDGRILHIPAGSITTIISLGCEMPNKDRPDARCMIISNVRGMSSYFLKHTARETMEQIKDAADRKKRGALVMKGKPKAWLELTVGENDASFFEPESINHFETVGLPWRDGTELEVTRVHFHRCDGQVVATDVDDTPENGRALIAALEEKEN